MARHGCSKALQDFIGTDEEEAVILKTSAKKNKGIKELASKLKELMKQKSKDKKKIQRKLV